MNQILKPNYYQPLFDRFKSQGLDEAHFNREVSFAIQHISKNSYLQKCNSQSFLKAVYNVALTGLTLNPVAGLAYIVPMDGEAVLMPSYKGLVKLLTDTGSVRKIDCQIVYEGDDIIIDLADNRVTSHIPYVITGREKGNVKLVYAVATLHDGSKMIEYMSRQDIDEIRGRSTSYQAFKAGRVKSAIWDKDYPEMAKKTVIKRLCKRLPRTEQFHHIDEAVNIDNTDYGASIKQLEFIDSLIRNCTIPDPGLSDIEYEVSQGISHDRATELIEYLKDHQKGITDGASYGQREIQEQLKKQGL